MYQDIPDDLKRLIEPILDAIDCELVDVLIRRSPSEGLIRVIIDQTSGDGRVSIANIETASREIAHQLEATDTMTGRYRLEVSSPGLDRVLARPKDFDAAVGSQVQLTTRQPIETRKRFKGTLTGFDREIARVEVDGKAIEIPFGEIEKAKTIYQFSRDDFSGKPAS